jgi:hypothetical protein
LLFFGINEEFSEFRVEYQVAPGWQMKVEPADGGNLMRVGGKPISQVIYLMNMNNAAFQLQMKASYRYGAQPLCDVGVCKRLPGIGEVKHI